jgi:hypothetical protein
MEGGPVGSPQGVAAVGSGRGTRSTHSGATRSSPSPGGPTRRRRRASPGGRTRRSSTSARARPSRSTRAGSRSTCWDSPTRRRRSLRSTCGGPGRATRRSPTPTTSHRVRLRGKATATDPRRDLGTNSGRRAQQAPQLREASPTKHPLQSSRFLKRRASFLKRKFDSCRGTLNRSQKGHLQVVLGGVFRTCCPLLSRGAEALVE